MGEATRLAVQRWLLGVVWLGVLFAIVAQSRAQRRPRATRLRFFQRMKR